MSDSAANGTAEETGEVPETADDQDASGPLDDASVWRYLRLGAVGVLALLALIATFQLYTNASAAIGQWVAREYVSVFQVAFNLVVLLVSLAGLGVLARRRG